MDALEIIPGQPDMVLPAIGEELPAGRLQGVQVRQAVQGCEEKDPGLVFRGIGPVIGQGSQQDFPFFPGGLGRLEQVQGQEDQGAAGKMPGLFFRRAFSEQLDQQGGGLLV